MPRAVTSQATVGHDGAAFSSWLKGVGEVLRHPWRWMTVDLTKPAAPPAQVEPFERLRAHAAGSDPGAVRARKELRVATLRGLAQATGKPMPALKD
ncbi:hypothetical protein [Caulobacter sp. RHG1]|uniref:hypothetical protein n=1 Tax=Caulobacter sp. (strain RHG1) TaxID=2545762 RepID=UPI00155750AE|nr:hypothetical protein [Caulobacter sp. RHG1]NQE62929.1 hypothetical protein [Caulobacter sp. RHG1]